MPVARLGENSIEKKLKRMFCLSYGNVYFHYRDQYTGIHICQNSLNGQLKWEYIISCKLYLKVFLLDAYEQHKSSSMDDIKTKFQGPVLGLLSKVI